MNKPPVPNYLDSMIEMIARTLPAEDTEHCMNSARAALESLAPHDVVEAMLAAHVIAAHHASMDGYRRAMRPGLNHAEAIRLRSSAIAAGRSSDAALHTLNQRRSPAATPDQARGWSPAPTSKPAQLQSWPTPIVENHSPSSPQLSEFTPEEIAAAEYELDNNPADLARAKLAERIPLHRWQDMTMDERKIAYEPSAKLTPAKLAVLGARLAATDGSSRTR